MTAIGNSTSAPTSITPATAGAVGETRLARVAASVEVAKNRAVRIPATSGGQLGAGVGGRGWALRGQVEHREGQLEQVCAERRQPADRIEHQAAISVRK